MTRTLSTRYVQVAITTPAASVKTAPLSTAIDLGNVILDSLEISLPGGSVGLMGFNLALAGQVVLPYGGNAGFIIRESADKEYVIGIEVDKGLVVKTYNTDRHSHVAYFTFKVHDIFDNEDAPQVVALQAIG